MRTSKSLTALFTLSLALLPAATPAVAGVHHQLRVSVDPQDHRLAVDDRLTLGDVAADPDGGWRFVLHAGLEPAVTSPGWRLERVEGEVEADFFGINATTFTLPETVPLEGYRLFAEEGVAEDGVELRYGGVIHHPLENQAEEYQRSFAETPGIVSPEGIYLAGASFWLPTFGDALLTFELSVRGLEPPWDVVSQGQRVRHDTGPDGRRHTAWSCPYPVEEVYLVAAPWVEYHERAGEVDVFVFLRQDDLGLAARYLDATARYLEMYESALPPFPFPSFALVENFWETGYGMPGFTLLGPQVIRFPWILTSSYPHELLHNWWGNSVYVDAERGNWCEGLTAYMADHLFAEHRSEDATYRRATLKKFTDFVSSGKDFPLAEFLSRHSAASEAVGYGKSLMLFHMLRRAVGDDVFRDALRRFAEAKSFERAAFADLADAVSEASGEDWRGFVAAWTESTGAPELEIADVRVTGEDGGPSDGGWRLDVELRQVQDGRAFPLRVPLLVTLEGEKPGRWLELEMKEKKAKAGFDFDKLPLRLDVDPAFDVMRRLDPWEVPPALSTLFGDDDPLYVLPAQAEDGEVGLWRELATGWQGGKEPRFAVDAELDAVPPGNVWLLGSGNRFAAGLASDLAEQDVRLDASSVVLAGEEVALGGVSVVLVGRSSSDPEAALGWVAADPLAAIPGLGRKLPHYTRYSYLAFRGDEPENTHKGLWRPLRSPLVRNLAGGELAEADLGERPPLLEVPPRFQGRRFEETVAYLASPEMAGRGLGTPELETATAWVEERFAEAGLEPLGDGGYRRSFTWKGGEPEREVTVTNLVAKVPGSDPVLAPVMVLAHIDHLGRGWPDVRAGNEDQVHPGADDNASGVAVLLELARALAAEPPSPRAVVFAVTSGEEAGLVGSRRLLGDLPDGELPFACLNLDTVGNLGDGKLTVLNASSAREWRFIFMGVGYTTGVPIAVATEPLDSSDQVACLERGVPAVQLFTGPTLDYHRPSDTPEQTDAPGMAKVAEAAWEALTYLAGRKEPMTVQLGGEGTKPPASGGGERRASLGTMPDFAFAGPGVRIEQVIEGSAAAAAGLLAGDVLVAMDGEELAGLREYAAALRAHAPGDEVEVTVLRGGERIVLKAVLRER